MKSSHSLRGQAVILEPVTNDDNLIQPLIDSVSPLILRAHSAGQTAALLPIQNSLGAVIGGFDSAGALVGGSASPAGAVILAPATSARNVIQATADATELTLKMFAGQGSAPLVLTDSAANVLGGFTSLGAMVSKGFQSGVRAVAANYTLTGGDFYVPVDATAGAVTITLPTMGGGLFSNHYHVAKVDASVNTVTVVPAGGQTIGGGNVVLANQFDIAILQGDAVSAWNVLKTTSLSPAVILAPNTPTRNTIQPTADTNLGLIIKAHSPTQSGILLDILMSTGAVVCRMGTPEYTGNPAFIAINDETSAPILSLFRSAYAAANAAQAIQMSCNNDAVVPLRVFGNSSSQSADTFQASDAFNVHPLFSVGPSDPTGTNLSVVKQGVSTSDTGAAAPILTMVGSLPNSLAATYTSRWIASMQDNAGSREVLRMEANGTAARIGFLGAAAIVRPANYTLAGSATRVFPADPSVAYSGMGTASVTDLNALRVVVSSLLGVVRQLQTDLGTAAGFGLLGP
jgi:hypothetical protein